MDLTPPIPEDDRRRGCPSAEEIAEHQAAGEHLTWIDGKPEWVKDPELTSGPIPIHVLLDGIRRGQIATQGRLVDRIQTLERDAERLAAALEQLVRQADLVNLDGRFPELDTAMHEGAVALTGATGRVVTLYH
jgi:hypothetical protein